MKKQTLVSKTMGTLILLSFCVLMIGQTGCNKKEDSPAPAPVAVAPVAQYSWVNGSCVSTANNQPVASTFCTQSVNGFRWDGTNCWNAANQIVTQDQCTSQPGLMNPNSNYNNQTGYQLFGGVCYSTFTGAMVDYTLCSTSPGYIAGSCQGYYWQISSYSAIQIYCFGTTCRGMKLIDGKTGTQVTCQ